MHSIFALRQLVHLDFLSHLTFLLRQVTHDLGFNPELILGEDVDDGEDLWTLFSALWMLGERNIEKFSSVILLLPVLLLSVLFSRN